MDQDDRRKALEQAKAELRAAEAEAEAARRKVQEIDETSGPDKGEGGFTKRDVAKAGWVAPLVMAVNMPDRVFAQNGSPIVPTISPPTPSPVEPTPEPT